MCGQAQLVARPAQTRLQSSQVTGPGQVHQIFTDVAGSSAMLLRASTLRSSRPLWNVRA